MLVTALTGALSLPVTAQTSTAPASVPAPVAVAPAEAVIILTAEQAKTWVGKSIYGSDGKNVGEVAAFARGTNDKVSEMHADIGGFLGLGETRVKLMPNQFKLSGDRVTIDMTSEMAKNLPRVQ
jgi:hypothetical protein